MNDKVERSCATCKHDVEDRVFNDVPTICWDCVSANLLNDPLPNWEPKETNEEEE